MELTVATNASLSSVITVWVIPIALLILAFITVLYTRRTVKIKRLQYKNYFANLIIKKPDVFSDKLKVTYEDNIIEELYLVEIKFKNTGNDAIVSEDFISPLKIISNNVKIFSIEVGDKSPEDIALNIDNLENTIILKFDLLNPGDYFTLKILSDKYFIYNVEGRIKNGKEINKIKRGVIASIPPSALASLVFITLMITSFILLNNIYKQFEGNGLVTLVMIAYTVLIVGGVSVLITGFALKYMDIKIHPEDTW